MDNQQGPTRAVSPVIGTVLMVAIIVVLATVGGAMFLRFDAETDPQPNVVLESNTTDTPAHALVHGGGESIEGERLELKGAVPADDPAGKTLQVDDEITFYPTSEEVTVVWYGDNEESYSLTTVEAEQVVPEPDESCAWVEDETVNGTESITIDNVVVNCDVETEKQVAIQNGGVVIGETFSDQKDLDADEAQVHGDVTVEKVLNLQDGQITGSATSNLEDVKIGNGSVDGSIEAEKVAEVTRSSTVGGDMESHTSDTKVLDGSLVEGSVTASATVKVENSTIEGDVYADPSDLDCTNATINGESCGSYTPEDPSNW